MRKGPTAVPISSWIEPATLRAQVKWLNRYATGCPQLHRSSLYNVSHDRVFEKKKVIKTKGTKMHHLYRARFEDFITDLYACSLRLSLFSPPLPPPSLPQCSTLTSSCRASTPSAWCPAGWAGTRPSTSWSARRWCIPRRRSPSRVASSSFTTPTVRGGPRPPGIAPPRRGELLVAPGESFR